MGKAITNHQFKRVLRIYILSNGQYLEVEQSPTFGTVPVKEIPRFIQEARINGELSTSRAFRTWVREKTLQK